MSFKTVADLGTSMYTRKQDGVKHPSGMSELHQPEQWRRWLHPTIAGQKDALAVSEQRSGLPSTPDEHEGQMHVHPRTLVSITTSH